MIAMRLETNDFRVITARTGREALERAKAQRPDLILLDILMFGMDGGEVARVMRKDAGLADVPVIYLTALIGGREIYGFPKKIAEKLFISPKTVENHRASIMKKLNLRSTMELVRYAAKLGLIDVDLWKD